MLNNNKLYNLVKKYKIILFTDTKCDKSFKDTNRIILRVTGLPLCYVSSINHRNGQDRKSIINFKMLSKIYS